jgi:hypothetical protein
MNVMMRMATKSQSVTNLRNGSWKTKKPASRLNCGSLIPKVVALRNSR